jgi:CheY-like chemotaxis protein
MKIAQSDILNASILIVDDQEINVSLLEEMLLQPRTRPRSARCIASTATI